MAKARGDFTDILVRSNLLGKDQLEEARAHAAKNNKKIQDALTSLGYVTNAEIMKAMAEFHNLQFVDLTGKEVAKTVIELVPESVARENNVIPLELDGAVLKLVTADPSNYDALQKL